MSPQNLRGRSRIATPIRRTRERVESAGSLLVDILTESFDRADAAGWGPDIAWDELDSDNATGSNEGTADDSGHPGSANAGGRTPALSSVDMYGQAVVASLVNAGGSHYGIELYLRVGSLQTSRQHYAAAFQGRTGNTQSEVKFYKYVAGSFSAIGSATAVTLLAPGDLLSFEVNGTGLTAKVNGATVKTATDSSITTGNRTGLFLGWNDVGNSLSVDDFEVGSL